MTQPIKERLPADSRDIVRHPTSIERLDSVAVDLDNINRLLEQLWLQRHMLYSAIRELKTVKRNIELAKARLTGGEP